MSVQFGTWNFKGTPPCTEYIERVVRTLLPYGPDGHESYSKGGLTIVYCAFHTTKESRGETQPHRSRAGAVITWDGRLDNRAELRQQLRLTLQSDCPDVLIVAAAYEQWGIGCLSKLIGDWALSIWIPEDQSLILAKDPIGTRPLYYALTDAKIIWSSLLDPIVLFGNRSFALSEEYIAGWLSFFPAADLTPYVSIYSVPPSSFVRVTKDMLKVSKYWDFDIVTQINYRTDAEYEEQFRSAFGGAVRRRLRSDMPIMAELSGGMDSSSIVCMADLVIGRGEAETSRLDTVSYYDDSEPNWNERPYFTIVEERRGRSGCHIDVRSQQSVNTDFESAHFRSKPESGAGDRCEASKRFVDYLVSQGNRVVLSGIGGDEVTGGIPTPIPELQDLFARGRFQMLAHQLGIWALNKRTPWFYLACDAAKGFLPQSLARISTQKLPAPWLNPGFVKRNRRALLGYERRLELFGAPPSLQEAVRTIDGLRRQLGCCSLASEPPYDRTYPYSDRRLLEFLCAIPRDQLVRPGQRRSLMRRALVGIVPDELLSRKRKAFVTRTPIATIGRDWANLEQASQHFLLSSLEIVDHQRLSEAVQKARHGQEVPIVSLMRTLAIEAWLRSLGDQGMLTVPAVDGAKSRVLPNANLAVRNAVR
jgi:asparagine synthase (glutamine-hydrolysing)